MADKFRRYTLDANNGITTVVYVDATSGSFTDLTVTGNTILGDSTSVDTTQINGVTAIDANSATAALRVTQIGSGNALLIEDSANPDATPVLVDATGKVVHGHTAALATFAGSTNTPGVQMVGTTVVNTLGLARFGTSASSSPVLVGAKANAATIGVYDAVVADNLLFRVRAEGSDGTDFAISGAIDYEVDGAVSADIVPGRVVIKTADSTGTLIAALRVTSAQDVAMRATKKLYLDGVAATGDTYIVSPSANVLDLYAGAANTLRLSATAATVTGNVTVTGDAAVNGGDITSSATTFNLLNATVTTLNVGGAATAVNLGAGAASILTASFTTQIALNTAAVTSNQTTVALFNSVVTTLNIGAAATAVNIGAATGTTTIANSLAVTGNATVNGNAVLGDAITDTIHVKGIFGVNVAPLTSSIAYIKQDTTTAADRGPEITLRVDRTVGFEESLSNPKALRVLTVVNTPTVQNEWAISGQVEQRSTGTGNTVAVSGTAKKYAATGGMFAGHFNALDQVSYNLSTDVTSVVGMEVHGCGMGPDHPTQNNGLGLRISADIVARTPSQGTPTWASWAALTVYAQYSVRKATAQVLTTGYAGFYYVATTGGTSAAVEPVWPTTVGATIVDGTVTWTCYKGGESGVGIRLRNGGNETSDSLNGWYRIGMSIEDDLGASPNPNSMTDALRIRTGGAYGIHMPVSGTRVHTTSDIHLNMDSSHGLSAVGAYTNAAIRVADDQYISLRTANAIKLRYNTGTSRFELASSGTLRFEVEIDATPIVLLNGTQVLKERETGWTAGTGTPVKGAFAAYAGATMSAGYVQAEAQATNDAAKAASQRLLAIEQALINHGLIGA